MSCGRHGLDPRTRAERLFLCDDCEPAETYVKPTVHALNNLSQLTLPPCPFCEGPPSVIVAKADYPYGDAPKLNDYGADGLDVEAYVFCHECGADGPKHEALLYDEDSYDAAERDGAELWISRTNKHRDLYDAGLAEGLNLYPREERA